LEKLRAKNSESKFEKAKPLPNNEIEKYICEIERAFEKESRKKKRSKLEKRILIVSKTDL
jgi:hypothetical protein